MRDDRFDTVVAVVWASGTRRCLLARLAVLPVLAAPGAFLTRSVTLAADHPVRRIQHRKEKRRARKRHRLEHQRDLQRRDNGNTGGGDNLLRDCPDLTECRFEDVDVEPTIGPLPGAPIGQCWGGLFKGCNPCNGLPRSHYDDICEATYPNQCQGSCFAA